MTGLSIIVIDLDWPSCHNVRDLGGLSDASGAVISSGVFIRSDSPNKLNSLGWAELRRYGVKTIIDLRSEHETEPIAHERGDILVMNLPHDGVENKEFWGDWNSPSWNEGARLASTPLYYKRHIDSMPERSVRVLQAIADAPAGGVLFHCIAGRDRTGMIAMLLLHLLDIKAEEIADDYCLSLENRLKRGAEADKSFEKVVAEYLESQRMTPREIVLTTLAEGNLKKKLRAAGLTDSHVRRLKARAFTTR